MNRRSYLKSIFGLVGVSITVYSLMHWLYLDTSITEEVLRRKKALIGELVELIIPTTDTPGAKAALVHEYILDVILNCNDTRQQYSFYMGLQNVEKYSLNEFQKEFSKCNLDEKTSVIEHFANKLDFQFPILIKINKKLFGQPFYLKLRELTVEGYCQSKLGATQALMYDYIPGKYIGSVPVTSNQRSWATK
jgi:hypothetical protein